MAGHDSTDPDGPASLDSEPPVSLVPEGPARSQDEIALQQTLGREEAAAYLEAIARGLRKGQIELRRGDESLALRPAERVHVALEASERTKGGKLEIELVWSGTAPRSERVSS